MKSSLRIAVVLFGFIASFASANEFVPGHLAYQITVTDPEGIRVNRKICISLVKLGEQTIQYSAADASEDTNCIKPELYGTANDIHVVASIFDKSRSEEIGRLYNRQGEESKWIYVTQPVGHGVYLRDEQGKNGKWIWVCSVPIIREEDRSIPEVYNKKLDEIDPRYMRVEFCTTDKFETSIVTHPKTGEKLRRQTPVCPAAKVCLEEKRLKHLRIKTETSMAHAAQATTTSVNQEVHNTNGGR